MAVPSSGEDLHEAGAFFDEAAGHEALAAEVVGDLVVHAIHFAGFFGFAVEIDDVGDFHLHAVGEFVGLHTGGEVSVLGMVFCVLVVEKGQLVQGGALVGAGFEGLGLEIEKGRAFWSEGSSLIISGEEAVGPILGPPLGEGHFGHDDVAGEVLVFRSESVGGPGSEGRIGSEARAGVQVEVSPPRVSSSGPWERRRGSEKMGRRSLLKLTFAEAIVGLRGS